MEKIPKISNAEWEVMKIIWKHSEITAAEIIQILKSKSDWKPTTVKSLINRLLKKKAIGFNKVKNEYLYYALLSEAEGIKSESNSFINKVFNGSINSMLLAFVQAKRVSESDIEELKNILNNTSTEKKG